MKRAFGMALAAVLLIQFGCSSYSINRKKTRIIPKLDKAGSAYVCLCKDGRFNAKVYQGSGITTTRIIMEQLSRHLERVAKGENTETCDEAFESALYGGHQYLICPSIIQWEDHYTEKTNLRDKVSIEIKVIDTLTGYYLDSAIIGGKSRIITRGGDQPQDLLATPIRIYVDSLFQ